MKTFHFQSEQMFPGLPEDIFSFFAAPENLERITPPWLSFRIVTPPPIEMRVGLLIDYRLRIHGLPISWTSEIVAWEPPYRFVDRQVRGPYRKWVHEHRFEARDGSTLATDVVEYAVPGGSLIDRLIVRPDIQRIFAFRRDRLARLLDGAGGSTVNTASRG